MDDRAASEQAAELHRRAEAALQQGEAQLRAVLDSSPFPVALVDEDDQNIAFWSRSALDLFGHTAPTAAAWYQLAYPDPAYRQEVIGRWQPAVEQARASGQAVNAGEYRVTCRDGSVRICELYAAFVPNRLVVTFNDITARKQAEEALRRERDRAQNYLDIAAVMLVSFDRQGTITLINKKGCEILGRSEGELLGQNWFTTCIPESCRDEIRQVFAQLLADGSAPPEYYENPVLAASGEERMIAWYNATLRDDRGHITGLLSSGEDITERIRADEALRQQEEELAAIYENAPLIMLLMDDERRVRKVNGFAEGYLGHTGEWVLGQRGGEALRCLHALNDPRGCGYGPHCADCALRGVVVDTLETGQSHHEVEADLTVDSADGPRELTFLVSTMRLALRRGPLVLVSLLDITARKRAEQALRESERELTSSQRIAHLGSWHLDLATNQVEWTEELYRMYGFDPTLAPPPYTEHMKLFTPASWEKLSASLANTRETGIPYELELETVRKDGSHGWMWARGEAITDSRGNTTGLWGAAQDITEPKQAEEALRESKALLEAVVENIPLMLFLKGATDLRYVLFNHAGEELLGYGREALLGRNDLDLYPPEIATYFMAKDREVLDGEAGQLDIPEEAILTAKQGQRLLHTRKARILGADGTTRYLLGISEDITEYKQAEEALRDSKALLEAVVENIPLMLFLKEAKDLRFVLFNRAGEELLGYGREVLLGRNNLDLFPPEQAAHFMAKDHEVLDGEAAMLDIPEETILTAKQGQRLLHTRKVRILGADGTTRYLLGISEDITERKQAEEEREKLQRQLTQAQKMEAVGLLAGGVAHDFNNMLTVILGNTDLAIEQVDPAAPLYADLQEIKKAGERSADLTRQLLAFSRQQTIVPIVLDLNNTVAGMLRMLQRLIGEDIDLAWRPQAGLWSVKMDPSQVDQILANLCVNARDAIGGVGKVTIETGHAVLDAAYCADHLGAVPGEYVLLAVSDNGHGMDEHVKAHLFEPFFTTKGAGRGTGLGLATVYGIVKQNNGYINVYSEPGQGTTFKIYLPRHASQAVERHALRAAEPPRGSETVLLVEDEPAILRLGVKMLEGLGYTVLAAQSPDEAMRLAEEHAGEIALMITDMVMPGMSGKDLAARLCARWPAMRCLFMSGYTADAIAHHGVLEEGLPFLPKPFTLQALAAKVREVLASAKPSPPRAGDEAAPQGGAIR